MQNVAQGTTMTLSAIAARLAMLSRFAVFGFVLAGFAACATAPAEPQEPSYIVFFTPLSAELDEAGLGVVADAGRAAQAAPGHRVVVAGYANRIGSADADRTLSKLRAQVVADRLAMQGVDRGRIALRPKGSVGGDPDIESRRVVIEID